MLEILWRTFSSTPAHHNATPAQHNTSSSTGNDSHDRAPLVFFHVPKAGTSFTSALLEYGCRYNGSAGLLHLLNDARTGRLDPVKARCAPDAFESQLGVSHPPLTTDQAHRAHVVGMFRAPIDRVASGLAHNFHDCEAVPRHLNVSCSATHNDYGCAAKVADLEQATLMYADCVTGCVTRMLTGTPCGRNSIKAPAAASRNSLAISRLQTAFKFMGDTGMWNRSVCIFCGLFAPRLQAYDYDLLFENVRPSKAEDTVEKAKSILRAHKWYDVADEAVYNEVRGWLDRVEPKLQKNERYKACRAEWVMRRRKR